MKRSDEEIEAIKRRFPNLPEHAIPKTRKRKRTATGELTYQILLHVKSLGGQAYRINSQGQYDPRTKKWRPSGQKKGHADIQVIYKDRFIAVEVKADPKDKLSEHQIKRKYEIEQAGGLFIIARNFDQFKADFQTIIDRI